MGNSKIVYYGETLIDLTGDTVEPAKLLKGVTAHDKCGTLITGTFEAAAPYAIISVTYPEGSVCTCSNGSVALTAKDTSGKALFVIPSAGTWTVKAVKDSQTASQAVEITAEGQAATVELTYELIMVPNDDYSTFWTGGTTSEVYGKFNITKDSIYLRYNDRGRTYVQTSEKISCQAGSVITINVSAFTNEATSYDGRSYLYIADAAPSRVSDLTAYTEITSTGEKALPIESAGSYYIGLLNVITGGGGSFPTKDLATTVDSFILR